MLDEWRRHFPAYMNRQLVPLVVLMLWCGGVVCAASEDDSLRIARAARSADLLRMSGMLAKLSASPDPDVSQGARCLLGTVALMRGDKAEAVRRWQALKADATIGSSIWAETVWNLLEQSRGDDSARSQTMDMATGLVENAPTTPQSYLAALLIAEFAEANNDLANAEASLTWAVAKSKRDFYAGAPVGIDPGLAEKLLAALHDRQLVMALGKDGALFARAESARVQGRNEDSMRLYREYVNSYPQAEHIAQAEWAIGSCLVNLEKYNDAQKHWRSFVKSDPTGSWRGMAMLGLADLALGRFLDPEDAAAVVQQALILSEKLAVPMSADWQQSTREMHVRAGILSWIDGNSQAALTEFKFAAAIPSASDRSPTTAGSGADPLPTGIQRLLALAEKGTSLLPLAARDATKPKANLALTLGQFYLEYLDYDAALWFFTAVTQERFASTSDQKAYGLYRMAHVRYARFDFAAQEAIYQDILAKYPRSKWVPDTLIALGANQFGRQDAPQKALASFQRVAKDWPDTEQAQTALWYTGMVHFWRDEWLPAKQDWQNLDTRYPANAWREILSKQFYPELNRRIAGQPASPAFLPPEIK